MNQSNIKTRIIFHCLFYYLQDMSHIKHTFEHNISIYGKDKIILKTVTGHACNYNMIVCLINYIGDWASWGNHLTQFVCGTFRIDDLSFYKNIQIPHLLYFQLNLILKTWELACKLGRKIMAAIQLPEENGHQLPLTP